MQKDIHPEYQEVLFVDTTSGEKFVCGSTYKSDQTEEFEGKVYPVCHVTVSSSSHPFFTGSKKLVDAEGRIEKFQKRFKNKVEESQKQQKKKEESDAKKKKVRPRKKSS